MAGALGYYVAAEGIPVEPFVALIAGAAAGTLVLIDRSRSLALAGAEPDPAVGLRGSLTYGAGVARRLIAAAIAGVAVFQYGHSIAAAATVAAEGAPGAIEVVTLDRRLRDAALRESFRVLPA